MPKFITLRVYKKALNLFQKYEVKMEVTDWDEKYIHMLHTFLIGDRVVAEGTSLGVIVSKSGVVPPIEVMEKVARRLKQLGTQGENQ